MTSSVPHILAISGGRVLPASGDPIENGTVLIVDGVIDSVGAAVHIPEGAVTVDATGKWVLPGLIDPHAHVGVHEEANGWAGADGNEVSSANTAGVRALDAINIEDEGFRDALRGGITTTIVKPGSTNPIGGLTVAVKTWGGRTVDEQVISADISVKSALGENPKKTHGDKGQAPSSRLGVAQFIRQALLAADAYRAKRDEAREGGTAFERDLAKESLARVLDGELYWDQHAHRHDDIATAVRMAEEFGYRLVINHGTEAHKLADVLADKGIPVIFGPAMSARSKVEVAETSIENVVTLVRSGVKVSMTTDHPVLPINLLVHQAALAVRAGLTREEALQALTVNAAEISGIDDRVGALEPGRDGDVVIWSGDPFDVYQRVEQVYIAGRLMLSTVDGRQIIHERSERFQEARA